MIEFLIALFQFLMFMLVTSVAVVLFGIAISWLFKAIEWNDKRGEKND